MLEPDDVPDELDDDVDEPQAAAVTESATATVAVFSQVSRFELPLNKFPPLATSSRSPSKDIIPLLLT